MSDGLAIGSGLAKGLSNVLIAKRQTDQQEQFRTEERQSQNALAAANFLINSGRVQDYSEIQPLMDIALGTGGKKAKGGADPHDILAHALSPALNEAANIKGGGFAPAAPDSTDLQSRVLTPSPAQRQKLLGVPLLNDQEMTARKVTEISAEKKATADAETQAKLDQAERIRKIDPTVSVSDSLIAVGLKLPQDQYGVIPTGGGIFDKRTGTITEPPSAKAGKTGTTGMTGDVKGFIDAALIAKNVDPRKATDEEIQSVLPAASKLAQDKISDQNVLRDTLASMRQLQEQVITNRQGNLPTGTDLQEKSRTITVDGKPYQFISKGEFTGADAQNAAEKASKQAGVIVVSPQEASQLVSAQGTLSNLDAFFNQIKSKLPADAKDRPLTSLTNSLSQIFQTDDQLGAFVSWDLEVVPMLRSLLVNNRITNTEFNKAVEARPKITDTVGTAAQKMGNLRTIIANSVKPILSRGVQSFSTALNGKTFTFDSQAKLDTFKRQFPDAK